MKTKDEKRLSDVTREASTNRVNKFADSLMPAAPKPKVEAVKDAGTEATVGEVVNQQPAESVVQPQKSTDNHTPVPAPPKTERAKKSGGITVADIVSMPVREGEGFNKMVRVTDEHHELLRLIAFQSRKPMNVIVHNLIVLLEQAYQKEQNGGPSDV